MQAENVKMSVDEASNQLVITVDLQRRLGVSKTGKTITVATTRGFQSAISNGRNYLVSLNVNVKGDQ